MDSKLQQLKRAWEASGSVEDEAAYLRERVRVGDLTQERLELARAWGSEAAARALGLRVFKAAEGEEDPSTLLPPLSDMSLRLRLRGVLALQFLEHVSDDRWLQQFVLTAYGVILGEAPADELQSQHENQSSRQLSSSSASDELLILEHACFAWATAVLRYASGQPGSTVTRPLVAFEKNAAGLAHLLSPTQARSELITLAIHAEP